MRTKSSSHRNITAEGALLEALDRSMGIIEFSLDGTILKANKNFLDMCGYTEEELLGCDHKILCATEYVISEAYYEFWYSLRHGEHITGLFIRMRKDGSFFWVDATYNLVFSERGEVEKIVKFCTDVTEHNEAVHEAAGKLDIIDRSMLVAEYAPEGKILSVNENFLTSFNRTRKSLVGQEFHILGKEYKDTIPLQEVWDHVRAGHIFSGRLEHENQKNKTVCLESIYAPVFNLSGTMTKIVQFASDISSRVQQEIAERDKTRQLSIVADETEHAVVIVDHNLETIYINAGFIRMFGYTLSDFKGRLPSLVFGTSERNILADMRAAFAIGKTFQTEELTYAKNGRRLWCSMQANRTLESDGEDECTIAVFADITDTKVRAILQGKALEALAHDVSIEEVLRLISREAERIMPEVIVTISGMTASGSLLAFGAPSLSKTCIEALEEFSLTADTTSRGMALKSGKPISIKNIQSDRDFPFRRQPFIDAGIQSFWCNPILSPEGELCGIISFFYRNQREPDLFQKRLANVLESIGSLAMDRESARRQMRQLSFFDKVTGLPNRDLLLAKTEKILLNQPHEIPVAVLILNIDRFKMVNDSLGHTAGDSVLLEVAKELQNNKTDSTTVIGRITGDEFGIVLPGKDATKAASWAKRLQERIERRALNHDKLFIPTVSIGISVYPINGENIEILLTNASIALRAAKKMGTGQLHFFSQELDEAARNQLSLEASLRSAIDDGGLTLYYQPQVLLQKNGLYGVEALCRWFSSEHGQVPPSRFIPLAEETNLIHKLSDWTLKEGCRQMSAWRKRGIFIPTMSINLSSINFSDPKLPEKLMRYLSEYELPTDSITIELTESVLVDGGSGALETIFRAHDYGIHFSMDDFGTGYSSLSYLHKLPVQEVKLDQSFVRDIEKDETSQLLSKAIALLGKSLKLTLVAEGVETIEQCTLLTEQGYDVAQGYLHSKPIPAHEFEAWYKSFLECGQNSMCGITPAKTE